MKPILITENSPGRILFFDRVKVTQDVTFRLEVNKLSGSEMGQATTYTLTFDPHNKKWLFFDMYLESVSIHIIGVNHQKMNKPSYRECRVEVVVRDPASMHKEVKNFILKTNKDSGASRIGLPWLATANMLTLDQATAIGEILANYFVRE